MYRYTLFDANPAQYSGTAWDTHTDVELEAEDDTEAREAVRDVMEGEAGGLSADDYSAGDRIYALIWGEDEVEIGCPSYELTAENLA